MLNPKAEEMYKDTGLDGKLETSPVGRRMASGQCFEQPLTCNKEGHIKTIKSVISQPFYWRTCSSSNHCVNTVALPWKWSVE